MNMSNWKSQQNNFYYWNEEWNINSINNKL